MTAWLHMQTNGFLLPFFHFEKSIQVMHTMSAFQLQCLHFMLCFVFNMTEWTVVFLFLIDFYPWGNSTVGFCSVNFKAGVLSATVFLLPLKLLISHQHMKTHHLFWQDAAICCFMTKSQDTRWCCYNDSHYDSVHYVKRILLAINRLATKL